MKNIYRKILVPARIGTHNCNKSVAANCNLSGVFAKIGKSHEIPWNPIHPVMLHPIYHPLSDCPSFIFLSSLAASGSEKEPTVTATATAACAVERTKTMFFVLWFRGLTMDICPSFRVHVQLALHEHLPWHLLGARVPSQAMTKPLRKSLKRKIHIIQTRSFSLETCHLPSFFWHSRAHGAPTIGRLGGVGIHNIHHAQTILQHTMPDWMSSESPGIAVSTEMTSGELSCRWDITIQRLSISLWWRSLLWWPILSKLTMLTSAVLSTYLWVLACNLSILSFLKTLSSQRLLATSP